MSKKKSSKQINSTKINRKKLIWFFGFVIVAAGIFLHLNKLQSASCANSISCVNELSGKYDSSKNTGEFMNKIVKIPDQAVENTLTKNVLGDTTYNSNKHIYVDLTNQKLYAKEGDKTVYEFLISSGKWQKTPTGDFNIWIKVNSTRMKGGSRELGTYYDLPNVQWTMFFYNANIPKSRGYGIHGAYWHNNFGHPMSHGCINMRTEEAKLIYDWADPAPTGYSTLVTPQNPGTPITIYGKAANY